jgi:hypothetical protein
MGQFARLIKLRWSQLLRQIGMQPRDGGERCGFARGIGQQNERGERALCLTFGGQQQRAAVGQIGQYDRRTFVDQVQQIGAALPRGGKAPLLDLELDKYRSAGPKNPRVADKAKGRAAFL